MSLHHHYIGSFKLGRVVILWVSRLGLRLSSRRLRAARLGGSRARRHFLLIVLFREADSFDLITHILGALLLQSPHETLVHAELRKEEVFVDAIEFSLHT